MVSFRVSRSGEESKAVEGFLQNRSTPTHILRSLRSSEPSMPVATGATKDVLQVEVCSACHPYFTGEQRIVDTEGRVDRMNKRYGLT